ncbi:MAG: peptidylprolyl isomerase [Planctomycetes bacterium]|nr:peptidylprolyl isomerase [Planctomycetota bacterium]
METPPPPPPPAPPPAPEPDKAPKRDIPRNLLDPSLPEWNQTAPAQYKAKFTTSKGDFTVSVTREWAPRGADRFYNLVKGGFYDDVRFFRVISNFMAQFGMNGEPQVTAAWKNAKFQDDPVTQSNGRGMITFATSGANSRTTQVFINFKDNANLDGMGFAPFGKITEGMEVVDSLYKEYGEGAPRGRGPSQGQITAEGNDYLNREFKELDYVKKATIVP